MNRLESQYTQISEQYVDAKEEILRLRRAESNLKDQLAERIEQRKYKEMYFELREVNKQMRSDFRRMELMVSQKENKQIQNVNDGMLTEVE